MCIIKNKNKKNLTIDLKEIIAKEYLESKKTDMQKFLDFLIKAIAGIGIFYYILTFLFGWGIITLEKTNAAQIEPKKEEIGQNKKFLSYFWNKNKVIGCFNMKTYKTRVAKKCTRPGDRNIILPDKKQIKIWQKFYNKSEIINRLALVNFESAFNEKAGNYRASWYVQTLRKYNIKPDIENQLVWLVKRQNLHKTKRFCGRYWNYYNYKDNYKAGEEGVLACLYRLHFHAQKGSWYARRGIITTRFYKEYFKNL